MRLAYLKPLLLSSSCVVGQDALGVQARRVAVYPPRNTTLNADAKDNVAVLATCNASSATQLWQWDNSSSNSPRNKLYLVPCSSTDPYQVGLCFPRRCPVFRELSQGGVCVCPCVLSAMELFWRRAEKHRREHVRGRVCGPGPRGRGAVQPLAPVVAAVDAGGNVEKQYNPHSCVCSGCHRGCNNMSAIACLDFIVRTTTVERAHSERLRRVSGRVQLRGAGRRDVQLQDAW